MNEAVILAGGIGKRLKPLTEHRPKPLIPIAGRPCIDYVIRSLVSANVKKIIITTSYLSDKVIKRIGDGAPYGAHILYSFEGTPMGTAGAVKKVEGFITGVFIVASGDVLADVDIAQLIAFHKEKGADVTLALTKVEDPTQFGIVELDESGRIKRFAEKPSKEEVFSNLINAGIYIISQKILAEIPFKEPFDFSKNLFPKLLASGFALYGKVLEGLWRDIGHPQDLLQANLDVVEREGAPLNIEGVKCTGKVILGKETTIERGVRIVGPAYIGDKAHVGRGSLIDRACVYDRVVVDRGATVRRSIVLDGTKIGWQSEVDESVVGFNCTIEEDVRLVRSILGDNIHINIHSRLTDANIAPPETNGER